MTEFTIPYRIQFFSAFGVDIQILCYAIAETRPGQAIMGGLNIELGQMEFRSYIIKSGDGEWKVVPNDDTRIARNNNKTNHKKHLKK